MFEGGAVVRNADLGVTDSGGVLAVHAGGERPGFGAVTGMETIEPCRGAGRVLFEKMPEGAASYFLGHRFIKTG